jgi:hypothetical protein
MNSGKGEGGEHDREVRWKVNAIEIGERDVITTGG